MKAEKSGGGREAINGARHRAGGSEVLQPIDPKTRVDGARFRPQSGKQVESCRVGKIPEGLAPVPGLELDQSARGVDHLAQYNRLSSKHWKTE